MNLRPSGYEPDELPDCSTPRYGCIACSPQTFIRLRGLLFDRFAEVFCGSECLVVRVPCGGLPVHCFRRASGPFAVWLCQSAVGFIATLQEQSGVGAFRHFACGKRLPASPFGRTSELCLEDLAATYSPTS